VEVRRRSGEPEFAHRARLAPRVFLSLPITSLFAIHATQSGFTRRWLIMDAWRARNVRRGWKWGAMSVGGKLGLECSARYAVNTRLFLWRARAPRSISLYIHLFRAPARDLPHFLSLSLSLSRASDYLGDRWKSRASQAIFTISSISSRATRPEMLHKGIASDSLSLSPSLFGDSPREYLIDAAELISTRDQRGACRACFYRAGVSWRGFVGTTEIADRLPHTRCMLARTSRHSSSIANGRTRIAFIAIS